MLIKWIQIEGIEKSKFMKSNHFMDLLKDIAVNLFKYIDLILIVIKSKLTNYLSNHHTYNNKG